jgi:hypothetical protein
MTKAKKTANLILFLVVGGTAVFAVELVIGGSLQSYPAHFDSQSTC